MIDLNSYKKKVYSQDGEDGMIEKFFSVLGIEKGWYCEFGATDGNMVPNTRCLRERNWKGILIEGNPTFFNQLNKNFGKNPDIFAFEKYVSCEEGEKLDEIISKTPAPYDIDLLSIDVDGNDLWIWDSLENYSPKLVIVEYNSNFPTEDSLTIPYNKDHRHEDDDFFGATPGAFNKLAENRGYDLVGYTECLNLFYCRKDLSESFRKYSLSEIKMIRGHRPSNKSMSVY